MGEEETFFNSTQSLPLKSGEYEPFGSETATSLMMSGEEQTDSFCQAS